MSAEIGWRPVDPARAEVTGHGSGLLAPLPPHERPAVFEHMERMSFDTQHVLFEPRAAPLRRVFFPVTAVVSLLAPEAGGRHTEIATVGREGMVGLGAALGSDRPTRFRAVVQMGGEILRLDVDRFRVALSRSPTLDAQVRAYIAARLFQISRNVVCAASRPAQQRLVRWLLQTADRSGNTSIDLTQQFLADMLNVRRATVSEAIASLAAMGAVRARRGGIEIVDRSGLEAAACACYEAVKHEHGHLIAM